MSEPFIGEVKIVAFNFAPKGWAQCNGQLLPISQNQALFSILGTTYGGNGQTTFALPNLQGCAPIHAGNGFNLGQRGGEASHTLSVAEMPAHNHTANGSTSTSTAASPAGNFWGTGGLPSYRASANTAMNASAIANAGGGQPHENRQPSLVLNIIIALLGIFPSRS